MRLTNQNGMLNDPIAINVPDAAESQSPDTGVIPYSVINLYAKAPDFEEIEVENIQIFANTVTMQNLELIPLSELPERWNKVEIFDTPPQRL